MKDKSSKKIEETDNGMVFNHTEPAYTITKGEGKWKVVRALIDPDKASASISVETMFASSNKSEVIEQFKILNGKILQRCLNESL